MVDKSNCTLYSGGMKGAESAFGEAAEKWGVKEINYIFEGQTPARMKNTVLIPDEELKRGDISMELASKMMNRTYYQTNKIRKVLQLIFHMVNSGHQVFVVGTIQDDDTVKGGTGWAVELAKLFNRPLSVYDQTKKQWFTWEAGAWKESAPSIKYKSIVGSGTRNLNEDGLAAINQLFKNAFDAS